jgi:phage-related protein
MMTLLTFVPPVAPSPGTVHKPKLSILTADFGEGYTQPTPNGLNHIRQTVALRWDALTMDQRNTIDSFLSDRGGVQSFWFQPFGSKQADKWTCTEWDSTADAGRWSMRASLVQSFG